MDSYSYVRIVDAVKANCPAALEGGIRRELFNVLKEFFDRSNCWLFQLVVAIQPNINDYQIDTCQNVIVIRLMDLNRPQVFPPSPPQYLPMNPPQFLELWTTAGTYGTGELINPLFGVPRDGALLDAGTKCPILRIRWNPQANEFWIAMLALNLSDPTDYEGLPNIPEWILTKYYRYIASGVMSSLMLQPGKPYSSSAGAALHGRRFDQGINLARTEARHMYTYSGQRWTFPQGWNYIRPYIRG